MTGENTSTRTGIDVVGSEHGMSGLRRSIPRVSPPARGRLFGLLGLFWFLSWGHLGAQQQPARPNVLLIYADDLGYGDLGSYGHHTIQSPNLDRLAAEGIRFTSFYSPSPLCSPSRASLLTGRTHMRTGIESWIPPNTDTQLGRRELTLARLLKDQGYQTWLAGKWHLNGGLHLKNHLQPNDHGFDRWLALHAWPVLNNRNPENFYRDGQALGRLEGHSGKLVVDEAIQFLDERDRERPFLLYLPMVEIHSPIASPDRYNRMYARFTRGEPIPFDNPFDSDQPPPTGLEARGPGEYYAAVTYMDAELGRLLRKLDELELRESTLVIFASDNGPVTQDWRNWWEVNLYGDTGGYRGRKGDLYEGGIRVPAIIRWPGHVPAGSVSDVPVSGYDIVPTLASMLGFDLPSDRPYDGEDISPLLAGRPFQRSRPLYWEFPDFNGFYYALRDGNWKLLADKQLETVRLFDLNSNRFEAIDLAGQRPEILAGMLSRLKTIRDSVASDPLRESR